MLLTTPLVVTVGLFIFVNHESREADDEDINERVYICREAP
jgi:hypothetical protein